MGDIIRFRPRQGATRPVDASFDALAPGGAEILLFTGVRYERHDEARKAGAKRPSRRGRGKKRA